MQILMRAVTYLGLSEIKRSSWVTVHRLYNHFFSALTLLIQ